MGPLLLLVALFGLFYVFLILPKQRELKRHNALVASLVVGDEVMTGSGFYGTLVEVDADTVRIELAPGTSVKLARRAVAAKVVDPSPEGLASGQAAVEPAAPEPIDPASPGGSISDGDDTGLDTDEGGER